MCYPQLESGLSTPVQEEQWLCILTGFNIDTYDKGRSEEQVMQDWEPPGIEHFIVPTNPAQHTQQAAHQVEDPNMCVRVQLNCITL